MLSEEYSRYVTVIRTAQELHRINLLGHLVARPLSVSGMPLPNESFLSGAFLCEIILFCCDFKSTGICRASFL